MGGAPTETNKSSLGIAKRRRGSVGKGRGRGMRMAGTGTTDVRASNRKIAKRDSTTTKITARVNQSASSSPY